MSVAAAKSTCREPAPPGAISHSVAETPDGLHIVDVWESREIFDRFAEEQIGPCSAQAGVPGPAETTFYDVHNYLERNP